MVIVRMRDKKIIRKRGVFQNLASKIRGEFKPKRKPSALYYIASAPSFLAGRAHMA